MIQRYDEFSDTEHALIVFAAVISEKGISPADFARDSGIDYLEVVDLFSVATALRLAHIEAQWLHSSVDTFCEYLKNETNQNSFVSL